MILNGFTRWLHNVLKLSDYLLLTMSFGNMRSGCGSPARAIRPFANALRTKSVPNALYGLAFSSRNTMNIVIIGLLSAVVLGAALYKFRSNRQRSPKESPVLALVKKRHALRKRLAKLVGDEFAVSQIVQSEARRLKVSQSSLEALEAAVMRVKSERQAMSQEMRRRSYMSSTQAVSPSEKPERDYSGEAAATAVLVLDVVNESVSSL